MSLHYEVFLQKRKPSVSYRTVWRNAGGKFFASPSCALLHVCFAWTSMVLVTH